MTVSYNKLRIYLGKHSVCQIVKPRVFLGKYHIRSLISKRSLVKSGETGIISPKGNQCHASFDKVINNCADTTTNCWCKNQTTGWMIQKKKITGVNNV
jgi:hypothetical protein